METATKATERGSAKLFALASNDHEGIARAIGIAKTSYEVKWWWKYGQPRIDLIKSNFHVPAASLGQTVTQLMQLNGPDVQVTAECFPLGTPKPDMFRLDVQIRTNV